MRYYIKTMLSNKWKEVTEDRYNAWCKNIRENAVALTKEEKEEFIKERTRIEKRLGQS